MEAILPKRRMTLNGLHGVISLEATSFYPWTFISIPRLLHVQPSAVLSVVIFILKALISSKGLKLRLIYGAQVVCAFENCCFLFNNVLSCYGHVENLSA
jgi:hypothetical protein